MDYSMDAIAGKIVLVIVALSILVALGGSAVFMFLFDDPSLVLTMIMGVNVAAGPADAVPFAQGVGAAMFLNIAKIVLMKRAVTGALKRDAVSAKLYLQGQYFLRLVLTGVVLLGVGWLHGMPGEAGNPQYVNFMGTFFGILTFPLAMYSSRFFIKDIKDAPVELESSDEQEKSPVQSAVDLLKAIGVEPEEPEPEETPEEPETSTPEEPAPAETQEKPAPPTQEEPAPPIQEKPEPPKSNEP